jgi:hypothetical protein
MTTSREIPGGVKVAYSAGHPTPRVEGARSEGECEREQAGSAVISWVALKALFFEKEAA